MIETANGWCNENNIEERLLSGVLVVYGDEDDYHLIRERLTAQELFRFIKMAFYDEHSVDVEKLHFGDTEAYPDPMAYQKVIRFEFEITLEESPATLAFLLNFAHEDNHGILTTLYHGVILWEEHEYSAKHIQA